MLVYVCVSSKNQADMAAIYYEKVDVEGHHFGPDSQQVRTAVQQLDGAMQMLNRRVRVSRLLYDAVIVCCTVATLHLL